MLKQSRNRTGAGLMTFVLVATVLAQAFVPYTHASAEPNVIDVVSQSSAADPSGQPLTTLSVSTTVDVAHLQTARTSDQNLNKLDTTLAKLADLGSQVQVEQFAERHALHLNQGRVHVQLKVAPGAQEIVWEAVEAAGGEVTGSYQTTLQGWLPPGALDTVAAREDVLGIHQPIKAEILEPNVGNYTSEGLPVMNGDVWHESGVTGAGVRIAVIDAGFQGYDTMLGVDLPEVVTTMNFADLGDIEGSTPHGAACAEIVYDVAPDAELYLVRADTNVDLAEAIDYVVSEGIDVVSTSIGWYVVGPGDGTGEFADLADSIRSVDAFWATAAGNDAQTHWGGPFYSDGSADKPTHLFNPAENQNVNYFGPGNGDAYVIPEGTPINVYLRWDDWGGDGATQDYDLFLLYWNGSIWDSAASSERYQDGAGSTPIEYISYVAEYSGPYGVVIGRWDATRDVHFELFAPNLWGFDERVAARSISQPADVPTIMAVGAADASTPDQLEEFSAHGPNNGPGGTATGGIVKPDITAYDAVSTESYSQYGPASFSGTSASTPHVAGAAALIRSAYRNYAVQDVWTFLGENAIDLGAGGKDNQSGVGRLYLADAPPSPYADLLASPAIVESGGKAQVVWEVGNFGDVALTHVAYGTEPVPDPFSGSYPYQSVGYSSVADGVYTDTLFAPETSVPQKIYLRAFASGPRATVWSEEMSINLDPHEPDNSPLGAYYIDLSTAPSYTVTSYISRSQDVDWYWFEVTEPGTRIVAELQGGGQADLDLIMLSPILSGTQQQQRAAWDMGTLEDTASGTEDDPAAIGWAAIGWAAIGWAAIGWAAIGWAAIGWAAIGWAAIGVTPGPGPEQVDHTVWWNTGDVYVAVGGANGGFNPHNPYTLRIKLDTSQALPQPPEVTLPEYIASPDPSIDTLYVTHMGRLRAQYGITDTDALWFDLETLALESPGNGAVIDLDSLQVTPANAINDVYTMWDEDPDNPFGANAVVEVVRQVIMDARQAYPNLKYIVIVGDDLIVPFYRVPDETVVGNEGAYRDQAGIAEPNSPAYATFDGQFYLTDNYYADPNPLPWRGRELAVPKIAIGRLVESPAEMRQVIWAYWDETGMPVQNGLVTGYDFLTDQALVLQGVFENVMSPLSVTALISDTWTDEDLRQVWLDTEHDLQSINAHFTHDAAIPADLGLGGTQGLTHTVRASEILWASAAYSGTVGFSVGCHSGYNAHDPHFEPERQVDFPQAMAARGATWIGNSGHGIGETVTVGYSEDLAVRFAEQLTQGGSVSVGQALIKAKQDYLQDAAGGSFSVYDEKVIVEPILYGLPFYTVTTQPVNLSASDEPERVLMPEQSATRVITFTNTFTPVVNANGTIYELVSSLAQDNIGPAGEVKTDTEINFGRPTLPILRYNLGVSGTYTVPRGVRLLGAQVRDVGGVNPAVSRLITEHVYVEEEPAYDFDRWYPEGLMVANRLGNWFDQSPQLVAYAAQYRSTEPGLGKVRLYERLTVQVYYASADETDLQPPVILQTRRNFHQGELVLTAMVTDTLSGVGDVSAVYSLDGVTWENLPLAPVPETDLWRAWLPMSWYQASQVSFMLQAVDRVGNVSSAANKGQQFTGVNLVFLPITLKP